jgi:hypothetical protein
MVFRSLATILFAAILSIPALACWNRMAEIDDARLDPGLRRVVTQHPDSVVGVLIRTTGHATPDQLAAISDLGVTVGSVVDGIVTGRARARDAVRLSTLKFVVYVELAALLHPTGR